MAGVVTLCCRLCLDLFFLCLLFLCGVPEVLLQVLRMYLLHCMYTDWLVSLTQQHIAV